MEDLYRSVEPDTVVSGSIIDGEQWPKDVADAEAEGRRSSPEKKARTPRTSQFRREGRRTKYLEQISSSTTSVSLKGNWFRKDSLLFSSWKRSILPGLCGILAGCLYRMNVFRIRRVKFPDFIASFFSRLSWPSTGSTSSPAPRNALGNVPSYASRQVEGNYAAPLSSAVEPPEESITTLVSMGFDRNSARQALIRARNDVNAATNLLLESQ
nr:rhomboid-like protein 20 [Ipomoea batatas]